MKLRKEWEIQLLLRKYYNKNKQPDASLELIVENQLKSAWPFWNPNHNE